MSEQNKIIEFWSDLENVKNASPEDIQSDILAYLKLIAEKNAEIERKDEALRFYADEDNWVGGYNHEMSVLDDRGLRAKEALREG